MVEEVSVNGYSMRAPMPEDAQAVAAVINAAGLAANGETETTAEETLAEWQTPGFDLASDARLVETADGQIIAYGLCWDVSDPHVRRFGYVRVGPDYRGQGIGTALNRWVEDQARSRLHTAPSGARVTLGAAVAGSDEAGKALLSALGYEPVRSFRRMVRPLDGPPPAPRWPDHLRARVMQPGEERAFFQLLEDAFADHWGHVDRPFEEAFARWQHEALNGPHYDPELFFLVEDTSNGELAAAAWCWPQINEDPEMGWVHMLGVDRAYRRQGVGLALLLHTFGEFYRRGRPRVGLAVDAESLTGATRLYERAGMSVAQERIVFEKVLREGVDLATQAV